MKKKILFAIVSAIFLGWSAAPVLAQEQSLPANACYTTGEIISDVTVNFMFFQGLYASKCDQLIEDTDKPTAKKYLSLHQEILSVHKETFGKFTADLSEFIERNGIDGKQYLLAKTLGLNGAIDASGVNRSGCDTLYGYMEKRRESWKEVITPILGEMALRDAQYPKCE